MLPPKDKNLLNIRWFGTSDRGVFDPYSLVHLSFGYLCSKYGLTFRQAMTLAVLYEIAEDDVIERLNLRVWEKEDKYNAVADILLAMFGYSLDSNNKYNT